MKKRVLIADDHKIFREGLRALLENQENIEVLGEADNGRMLVKMTKKYQPELVIVDVAMPDMNGIEAARQIRMIDKNIRLLALSMHSDSRFVMQMLQAGAMGYLLKDCAFDELTLAMNTVSKNQIYLSPGITDLVIKDYLLKSALNNPVDNAEPLTAREREILQLLAEGKSTVDIADLLNISGKTVDTHRRQIMEKLGIHSIAELTKYAIRKGITPLDK